MIIYNEAVILRRDLLTNKKRGTDFFTKAGPI